MSNGCFMDNIAFAIVTCVWAWFFFLSLCAKSVQGTLWTSISKKTNIEINISAKSHLIRAFQLNHIIIDFGEGFVGAKQQLIQ